MADFLTIEVDDAKARAWFDALQRRGQDLSPLMRDIGEGLTERTQKRFATGIAPDGTPWEPLADGSGRTPLVDSGRTRDDISPNPGADFVEIRAGSKQARWHQEGTDPYKIKPRNKKALAFNGKYRRGVNHPGLPARPFIGLSMDDEDWIGRLVGAYLDPEDG
jgi:phage gpG-like protein